MGGKRLSFPKRKKYVSSSGEIKADNEIKKEVTPEEHRARVEMLKKLGLIK